ncbi:hypothetical protein [Nisaea sp.]|uniref:hypothetical protein n=1 Tax=Nisaea sp. TaxID=2024842 RepID=UPI0032EF60BB
MSPDECEVFDLMLNGSDPSDPEHIGEFVARIDTPLSELITGLIQRDLLQKIEANGRTVLRVNPAAAWFLAAEEERTAVL